MDRPTMKVTDILGDLMLGKVKKKQKAKEDVFKGIQKKIAAKK